MKYLTIDTTTKITALALGDNDRIIEEIFLHTGKTHSERLIPMLNQLMEAAEWTMEDIDLIGVVRGPGSFTGIRIGIATAQGLAQVMKIPLIGVLSLDVISWAGYERDEDIVVILDARKNEWYAAVYSWQGNTRVQVIPPCAQTPDKLLAELVNRGSKVCFAGDAVKVAEPTIRETMDRQAVILPQYQALPRGAYAVQEVWREYVRLQKIGAEMATEIEPYYIRFSEAEVNYRKKMEQKADSVHTLNNNE